LFGVSYSPDSRFLAMEIRGQQHAVRVWEVATGRLLKHLNPSPVWGGHPFFSADGRILFTPYGRITQLWEVAPGQERCRLEGHLGNKVSSLLPTSDGRMLFSGGDDTQVLAWDLAGRRGAAKASAAQIQAGWDALAGADARAAFRAVWALA